MCAAIQTLVLECVTDRAEVQVVRLRDIKYKIDRKISDQDRYKNTVSTKDVFKVIDGPCKANPLASRVAQLRTPSIFLNSPGRSPGRGVPPLFDRTHITGIVNATTIPYRDTHRYGFGSVTPIHPSRTLLHPYMTPMRDSGATPIHDGMRTPMRDGAWTPYTPMRILEKLETLALGDLVLNISRGVLVQEHTKHQILVQDGPALLVGVTVKLAHRGTTPLPMVT
nr:putative transcription elongation factor SPT5 homolog 1 [Tanacetum cinerariifolium]